MTDYVGKQAGNFSIIRKLGDGGFATVYLAQHTVLEKRAAVKFLLEEWRNEPDVVARFFDEARTMERLKDHPNIIRILDIASKEICDREGLPPYFIMDFIDGKSLEGHIQGDEGFTLEFIAEICKSTLSALDFCHKRGIIHRDIKPSNILIDSNKHIWLVDFGIAKARLNTSKTGEGLTLGSCDYMSPEQALGKRDLDHRSDIYSFGVTMYQMVLGKLPFINENPNAVALAHIQEEPIAPKAVNDAVPDRLNYIILKAMEKKAEDRFQTCQEMIEALETLNEPEPEVKADIPTLDLTKTQGTETPEDSVRTDHANTTRKVPQVESESRLQAALRSSAVRSGLRLVALILGFTVIFLGGFKLHQWMFECDLGILTDPAGAMVEVNDSPIGTSPTRLTLKQGVYKIVCSLEGYRSEAMRVDLSGKGKMDVQRRLNRLMPELLTQLSDLKKAVPVVSNAKKGDKVWPLFQAAWAKLEGLLEQFPFDEDLHDAFVEFVHDRRLHAYGEGYYRNASERDKENVLLLIMLGRLQMLRGDKKALDTLSSAWYLDPNSVLLLNSLGDYFAGEGLKDKARQYYQTSLSLKKDTDLEKKLKDL